jgi:hypothetical protein
MNNPNYWDFMGLKIAPIVYYLHEFEEWISNRIFDNLAEFIPKKHSNLNVYIEPDNQGHNYQKLSDITL